MKSRATRKELRKFAWVMAGACTVFAAVAQFRGGQGVAVIFISVASLFLVFGLILPMALGPVYRVWMGLAHVLAWINTRIILSVLFYLVFTPISLVMRLMGRDGLARRIDRSNSSYWQARKGLKPAKDSYEHLY